MKVKIFESDISGDDLENKIAAWVSELNPTINSVNVNVSVMNDYFADSAPPMVCNTWYRYTAAIVYNILTPGEAHNK